LLVAVNVGCVAVGAGIGAALGAVVPLALAGFGVGFFLGIGVVAKRFRDV
jgi:hypothetical protein